jgi:hypothetical protein
MPKFWAGEIFGIYAKLEDVPSNSTMSKSDRVRWAFFVDFT